MLPGILGCGVALAGLPRQAHSQDVRGLEGDGDLAGAEEGQGGHGHVGQVGGRHLQAREVLIPAWMPLFMIKIFQTAFAVAFSVLKLIYCTSQIKDPQEGGELRISLVQELVGSPLPEAHPAVGPAGRQEGSAGVRRQT